jgi:hypothetical protein
MENKETLKEVAEKYVENFAMSVKSARQIGFIDGAKWQAERMYSEEEVKQIIDKTLIQYSDYVLADVLEWFEQFKKK